MRLRKLLKSKKGFNDMVILVGYIGFILISSLLITIVNAAFGSAASEFDADGNLASTRSDVDSINSISAFSVILNVFKLTLWDVGDTLGLPFYIDIFYTIFTIMIITVIARNIWIGGGS